eukprot:scaffold8680_cov43-Phaeocystis_antarctica.AAC.1
MDQPQCGPHSTTTNIGASSNPRPHRRPGRGCYSTAAHTSSSSSQSRAASRAADTQTSGGQREVSWCTLYGGAAEGGRGSRVANSLALRFTASAIE